MAKRDQRRVSATELRAIFNGDEYYERVLANELLETVEDDRPAPPGAGQPAGTRSQTVWYWNDKLERVALVHRYVCPDGSIGGSGRPDPKRLLLDGVILYC